MKKSIIFALLLALTFVFTVNAQNFSRLEKLADELKTQSVDLVHRTNKAIKKDGMRSSEEIRSAFLAEQFRASAQLIERIIDNRLRPSEVRYAGMVLSDLSKKFPVESENSFEWLRAQDTIEELSRELRGLNIGVSIEKVGFKANNDSILGKAVWSGMVDADVLLVVKGSKIQSETVSGRTYPAGAYSFTSKIPQQDRIRVGVKLKNGRGKIHVVQQPTVENDFTTLIQIRDELAGARTHSVEIFWYRR